MPFYHNMFKKQQVWVDLYVAQSPHTLYFKKMFLCSFLSMFCFFNWLLTQASLMLIIIFFLTTPDKSKPSASVSNSTTPTSTSITVSPPTSPTNQVTTPTSPVKKVRPGGRVSIVPPCADSCHGTGIKKKTLNRQSLLKLAISWLILKGLWGNDMLQLSHVAVMWLFYPQTTSSRICTSSVTWSQCSFVILWHIGASLCTQINKKSPPIYT